MEYIFNTNAYVEQSDFYNSDKVKAKLDETNKVVTLELVDEYGNSIAGAPKLVNETFTDLEVAVDYYQEVIHQLSQGDVVRNYKRTGSNVRKTYDADNGRYPSF